MKKIAGLFVLPFVLSCVLYCEDFDSFIKNKTYLPVEYLDALKGEDRNILLKYNPQIENNSEYDFAFEKDIKWYENGTFRYMEFSMRMDLFFGNSFFIEICDSRKETFGYIIKGKQTSHSKDSFDGTYPCLVDLSPLENLNTDDALKIEIDGDYINCSVVSRKFSHKYFLASKGRSIRLNRCKKIKSGECRVRNPRVLSMEWEEDFAYPGDTIKLKIKSFEMKNFNYSGALNFYDRQKFSNSEPLFTETVSIDEDEKEVEIELPVDKLNMSYKDKAGFAKLCAEVVIKDIDCSYVAKETLDILIDFERY